VPKGGPKIGRDKPKPKGPDVVELIEDNVAKLMNDPELSRDERIKLIGICVRFAAVKSNIVLSEHGSGFAGLGDDDD
jgi:hypothetical protein